MRLNLGFGLLGVGLSLAIAVPLVSSCVQPAAGQTAAAPSTRKAPGKRTAGKSKAKAADSGKPAPAETDRLLDGAAKSLAEGKPDAAMTTLDRVLTTGGLNNAQMARALYLRGVTHRRKGHQAQAIADLTSAIWLKGGLSEADRNAALKERSEVSREVGVADAPPPQTTPPAKAEPAAKPVTVARTEPAAVPAPASAPTPAPTTSRLFTAPPPSPSGDLSEGGFPRPSAQPARTPERQASRVPRAPARAVSSWQSGTKVATKDGWVAAEERQQSRAPAPEPGASGNGSGLGDFFSGLFGGNGAPARPATKTARVSDWSTSTSTRGPATRQAKPKGDAIVTSATPQSATAAPARGGGYRLQIAAVRSRIEAEAVAARLRKDHKRVVGAKSLDIDQTVFGNMGTFYRVRLGPFAVASEPKALCDQLRPSGYDCLVVTQ